MELEIVRNALEAAVQSSEASRDMSELDFYTMDSDLLEPALRFYLGIDGKLIDRTGGVCGEIYIFDQGENHVPRYVCAKVPRISRNVSKQEAAQRFVQELRLQLSFYGHIFVHWTYDLVEVLGAPAALFRYYGSDLKKYIEESNCNDVSRLSIMAYVCSGLKHCYDAGLVAHQDLKPANIFLRDIKAQFKGLPDLDIYRFPVVADFGLANASVNSHVFEGSRPYMAPEQWDECTLSSKTDVFALGVILCELLTRGYHPNGIKLNNFWPKPIAGISTKWTRNEPWKKWASSENKIDETIRKNTEADIISLVDKMMSSSTTERPSIDETLTQLLSMIEQRCTESHSNVQLLISHYSNTSSNASFEEQWPYLHRKWLSFEARFG